MSAGAPSSASNTPNAAESKKAPEPPRFERGKTYYLRYVGKQKYMGDDPGDKTIGFDAKFLSVQSGEVIEVSAGKAKQLLRDYRSEWQPSDEKAYEKSERDRQAREDLERERAAKQHEASIDRARREKVRSSRSSLQETDDEFDE